MGKSLQLRQGVYKCLFCMTVLVQIQRGIISKCQNAVHQTCPPKQKFVAPISQFMSIQRALGSICYYLATMVARGAANLFGVEFVTFPKCRVCLLHLVVLVVVTHS
jgi:hypothetical protein